MFGLADGGRSGATCSPDCGIVFKITPDGTYSTLYQFCALDECTDDFSPTALLLNSEGDLFGTNYEGGRQNSGTVFALNGTLSVLYSFCDQGSCSDGRFPEALAGDAAGNLFGVAVGGGVSEQGTVFALKP
jgi:uncharacterized repeat protein (TIGR03803 family)